MTTYTWSTSGSDGSVLVIRTEAEHVALPLNLRPSEWHADEQLFCEGREEDDAHRIGRLPDGGFTPYLVDELGTRVCIRCHLSELLSDLKMGTLVEVCHTL